MRITGLVWLRDIVLKLLRKHSVAQEEVAEVFWNHPRFRFIENGHHPGENVYAALGRTDAGRYLIVFFVHKSDRRALILSARDMTRAERRQYEKK
jgi:uncharacterized DUF497 family protein